MLEIPEKENFKQEFSLILDAVENLKKGYARKEAQIESLKRQNADLRTTDLWRRREMKDQDFEIWKLKEILKEAGYDPKNLPQPKALRVYAPKQYRTNPDAVYPSTLNTISPLSPAKERTSSEPTTPSVQNDSTPKRKSPEPSDEEEEIRPPSPKRRAGSPKVAERMEKKKVETTASLFKQYLEGNDLPASKYRETVGDKMADREKEENQVPRRSAEFECFAREMKITLRRSMGDAEKVGDGEDDDSEDEDDEDEDDGEEENENDEEEESEYSGDKEEDEEEDEEGDEEDDKDEEEMEGEEGEEEDDAELQLAIQLSLQSARSQKGREEVPPRI
ncbi:hypothetical protein L873DRAFT_1805083 [Choiromyces venosus 120613-1]|uniref:Uncharacterized protein n=1 Tax=Choiromyces venosus 120613-1 TaxID=1336337 RepID=A0A3N4JQK9_9PEZI|nr:hypothetical protein L873DRAFT_1805083 [Choiromyces venosus 120613-1]